jgi:hypothetical protein
LIISHKTYPIYLKLLDANWLKSNLKIAKELRPEENFNDKQQKKNLTNKVSRSRKILFREWLIKQYNTYGQKISIGSVKIELTKLLEKNFELEKSKKQTHREIAEILWLNKTQVDNFSRTLKNK